MFGGPPLLIVSALALRWNCRYFLDEAEDPQYDRHNDDVRVVAEPGWAGYDRCERSDVRIREQFRDVLSADPWNPSPFTGSTA